MITLSSLVFIGSTLDPTIKIGETEISFDLGTGHFQIGDLHTETELRAPNIAMTDSEYVTEMFSALLTFLTAFNEAYDRPESENYDLFPDSLREWAYQNDDEISFASYELSGSEW